MAKKRPRAASPSGSKQEPHYWRQRLFKSRYTYHGKPCEVRHWSVKIQHLGKRKTFSLWSSRRSGAAVEACALYRALVTQGWENATRLKDRNSTPGHPWPGNPRLPRQDRFDRDHWTRRLIRRRYTMDLDGAGERELAVRIEDAGTGYYFPLGTDDPTLAAKQALQIYRTITCQGWDFANRRFPRELTVAFHWLDNPLVWTYTTLETRAFVASNAPARAVAVTAPPVTAAVAEPDEGIRRALEWCLSRVEGLSCRAVFTTAEEALRSLRRKPCQLVLFSHSLPDKSGAVCLEELKAVAPDVVGLLYSVYPDSDELFRRTPGGARTYLLRRTPATRLLEPIEGLLKRGPFSREEMTAAVWQHFKDIFAAPSSRNPGPPLANLTPREQEVLGLLTRGNPDKDIADQLGISIHTAHEHVKNIFDKLGVHSRTEAVVKFLQK